MTNNDVLTFTRQQLYDEVWKQSAAKFAKQYNLHYGRFINSLKQANIPYPPSGYWTRVDYGKDVSNELVPLSGDGEVKVQLALVGAVVTRKRKPTSSVVSKEVFIEEQKNMLKEELISDVETSSILADTLPSPATTTLEIPDEVLNFLPEAERTHIIEVIHSLEIQQNVQLHKSLVAYKLSIKEYKDALKDNNLLVNNKSYYDRRKPVEPPQFIDEVSENGLNRIITIMDALFKAIETLDGTVEKDFSVKIIKDIVRFKFIESQDKVSHELTKQEAKELLKYKDAKRFGGYVSEPKIRKYDNVYNGKLRIVFDDSSYIRDNMEFKLEDRLDEILIRLYEISEAHRISREKCEEEHRLYLEAQLREEELRERKQQEANKTHALENLAKDYQIACDIRDYIAAVMNKGELTEDDFEWIEWAKKKADWFDPIIAREDEYLGKREHSLDEEDKAVVKKRQGNIYGRW